MHVVLRYHRDRAEGPQPSRLRGPAGPATPAGSLADLGGRVHVLAGRLRVDLPDDVPRAEAERRLGDLFGVANFSRAHEVPVAFDALAREATAAVATRGASSFCVRARRSFKGFLTSPRSSATLGRGHPRGHGHPRPLSSTPSSPSTSRCSTTASSTLFERQPGAGGFPVGSLGRVAALLGRDRLAGRGLAPDEAGCTVLPSTSTPSRCRTAPPSTSVTSWRAHPDRATSSARASCSCPSPRCSRRSSPPCSGAAARRPLPPVHGPHRGGRWRQRAQGASAGDGREPRAGRLADPRQHDRDRRGARAARAPAPRGMDKEEITVQARAHRDASRSARCPTRTAASSSCPAAPRRRPRSTKSGARSRSWTWTAWLQASARQAVEGTL